MLLFTSAPTRYGIMDATPFTGERTSVYERLLLALTSSALQRASFASASTRSFCAVMRSNSDTTSCSYRSLLLSRMSFAVERAASALLTFATAISYAALYGVWSMTKSTCPFVTLSPSSMRMSVIIPLICGRISTVCTPLMAAE